MSKPNCIQCEKLFDGNKVKREPGRNTCKGCRNAVRNNKILEAKKLVLCNKCITKDFKDFCQACVETSKKICRDCKQTRTYNEYKDILHHECRGCAKKLKIIPKDEIIQKFEGTQRECISCYELKDTTTCFSLHINNYRNNCKECLNLNKSWIVKRLNKMKEDTSIFKEHNIKSKELYHHGTQEQYLDHVKVFNTSVQGILCQYYNNAEKWNTLPEDLLLFASMIKSLIVQDCFYCGRKTKEGNIKGEICGDYNGVDRVNSKEKYIPGNCVPCCKKCNMIKNTYDIGSFIRKCVEISHSRKLNNIEEDTDWRLLIHENTDLTGKSCSYNQYFHAAKNRNLEFTITQEEFSEIIKHDCYLCGKSNPNGIGIDRINSNIGYVSGNMKACCSYCNFMKLNLDIDVFLNQIKKIVEYTVQPDRYNEYLSDIQINGHATKRNHK